MSILNKISAKYESDACLLCYTQPCTNACPNNIDPAKIIRSLRFENIDGAAEAARSSEACSSCIEKSCEKACSKAKIDRPIRISNIIEYAAKHTVEKECSEDIDLAIDFCGVPCENPFFLSSSVVASNYEMVAKAFEMGWAGAAFKTIGTFVPEEVSPRFATISKEGNSFIGFKNIEQISDHTLEENIGFLKRLKKEYPNKILIASILGTNEEEWTYLAKKMTEANVDIIECNFSCPHMEGDGLGSDVGQNPQMVADFTKAVRKGTHLPILAKMTPNLGNMETPAIAAMEAGADGIAAINTIKSIMNVNLENYSTEPQVQGKSSVGGYSGKTVKPIALRFIHDMKKHEKLKDVPISGMGGIETWYDAIEFIVLGCANLQITTSVMQYGYRIIDDMMDGFKSYMQSKGYKKVEEIVGKALPNMVDADQLNRSTVVYPDFNREQCIGCGRCYISCYDGGHQAIEMDGIVPKLKAQKCVGCHLCSLVCPAHAIGRSKRISK